MTNNKAQINYCVSVRYSRHVTVRDFQFERIDKMDKYFCGLRADGSLADKAKDCFLKLFIEIAFIVYKVQMTTTQFKLIRLSFLNQTGQKPRKHVYQLK